MEKSEYSINHGLIFSAIYSIRYIGVVSKWPKRTTFSFISIQCIEIKHLLAKFFGRCVDILTFNSECNSFWEPTRALFLLYCQQIYAKIMKLLFSWVSWWWSVNEQLFMVDKTLMLFLTLKPTFKNAYHFSFAPKKYSAEITIIILNHQ